MDAEDCFRFDVGRDNTPYLREQSCPCELTVEEEDAMFASITDARIFDFIQSWEPPGV